MVYRLRRAGRDVARAIVFEPLAFRERLAALVPRPRAHLLTDLGVLAPAAQWGGPDRAARAGGVARPGRRTSVLARLPRRAARKPPHEDPEIDLGRAVAPRVAVDVLTCPDFSGARRLIATITEGLVGQRILDHLELSSSRPPMARARVPPRPEFAW